MLLSFDQFDTATLAMMKQVVPDAWKADGIDMDALLAKIIQLQTPFGLQFVGKQLAQRQTTPTHFATILGDSKHNLKVASENRFYSGDNLVVLQHLRAGFRKKIHVIYIDPPYNTGKKMAYRDRFMYTKKQLKQLGISPLQIERLKAKNGADKHAAWLAFMYPRLVMAAQLLRNDGVVFVSIDEHEYAYLRVIMDEIFGSENFITSFVWEKTHHFGRQKINSYHNAEYIVVYAKKLMINHHVQQLLVERSEQNLQHAPLYNATNRCQTLVFPPQSVVFDLSDGIYTAAKSAKYQLAAAVSVKNGKNVNELKLTFKSRWSQTKINEQLAKGTTFWIKTQKFAIRAVYASDQTTLIAPKKLILTNPHNPARAKSRFNHAVLTNEAATKKLTKALGTKLFSYPKPVSLIEYLISLYYPTPKNEPMYVLDFFAGSATTAEAVMRLNALDGKQRRFLLVNAPEGLPAASKFATIDELAMARIKSSAVQIKQQYPELSESFGQFLHYTIK